MYANSLFDFYAHSIYAIAH